MSDKNNNNKNPHRRISDVENSLLECKTEMGKELEKGNIKMKSLSIQVKEVKESVEELNKNIGILLKIFKPAKGFWIFSGWIAKFIIKFALFAGSIAALIYFIKTGNWQK